MGCASMLKKRWFENIFENVFENIIVELVLSRFRPAVEVFDFEF